MKKNDFIAKAISELITDGFSIKLLMEKSIDGKYGGWFKFYLQFNFFFIVT